MQSSKKSTKSKPAPASKTTPGPAPTAASRAQPQHRRPGRPGRIDVDVAAKPVSSTAIAPNTRPTKPSRALATAATKTSSKAKPTAQPRGLSALRAAAQVVAALKGTEAAEGISSGELIERMAKQKLWSSQKGKTPEATLYAAMVREIKSKGAASRFRRVSPGRFTAGGVAASNRTDSKPAATSRKAKA